MVRRLSIEWQFRVPRLWSEVDATWPSRVALKYPRVQVKMRKKTPLDLKGGTRKRGSAVDAADRTTYRDYPFPGGGCARASTIDRASIEWPRSDSKRGLELSRKEELSLQALGPIPFLRDARNRSWTMQRKCSLLHLPFLTIHFRYARYFSFLTQSATPTRFTFLNIKSKLLHSGSFTFKTDCNFLIS